MRMLFLLKKIMIKAKKNVNDIISKKKKIKLFITLKRNQKMIKREKAKKQKKIMKINMTIANIN